MDFDPRELGPVGAVKTFVNAGLAMLCVGVVLSRPKDFESIESLVTLGVALVVACGFVEWLFREWHKEQAAKIEKAKADMEDAVGATGRADKAEAAQRFATLKFQRAQLELLRLQPPRIIISDEGTHFTVEAVEPERVAQCVQDVERRIRVLQQP